MAMESINPATGETIATYEEHTPEQVNATLDRAIAGFEKLRSTSFAQRAAWMRAAGDVLRARKHEFGSLMTSEMGKPITEAEAEAEKCAWVCDYYAEHAETFLQPDPRQSNASESYVAFEPIGPVLAIMPWNFPFWQVFRFAAPALMAGNTG